MPNENDIERQPTPDLHSAQSLQLDALTATQRIRQVEAKVDSIERALCRIFGAEDGERLDKKDVKRAGEVIEWASHWMDVGAARKASLSKGWRTFGTIVVTVVVGWVWNHFFGAK